MLVRIVRIASLATLLVIAMSALLVLWLVDVDDYRHSVALALSDELGLDVRMAGPLELVLGLRPMLRASGMEIYQRDRAAWPESVAQIGRVTLVVRGWRSLVEGRIVLDEIRLDDPILRLVRRADGVTNWRPDGAGRRRSGSTDGGAVSPPEVSVVEIRNAVLEYEGMESHRHFRVEIDWLDAIVESGRPPRRVRVETAGRYLDDEFELGGEVGWNDEQGLFASSGVHRLSLEGRIAETSLRAAGEVLDPRTDARADLRIEIESDSLEPLSRRLGLESLFDVAGLGPAHATVELHGGRGQVTLDPVHVEIHGAKDERIVLEGAVDWTGEPSGHVDIRIDTRDVGAWARRFGLASPSLGPGRADARVDFSRDRIGLASMRVTSVHGAGARVELGGDLMRTDGRWTGSVSLRVEGEDGRQALLMIDDILRQVRKQERDPETWPGGRPLGAVDRALLGIGPARLSATIVEEGGGWAMRDMDLEAGEPGVEWVRVNGGLARILPALSGVNLAIEAATNDLRGLGERMEIALPKLDRLRMSATLVGDPDALMLDGLSLAVEHGDLVSIAVNGDLPLDRDLSQTEFGVSVSASDLAVLGAIFDRPLWHAGPVQLNARVRGSGERVFARGLRLRLGSSLVDGDIELSPGSPRPRVVAILSSPDIHLRDLGLDPDSPDDALPPTLAGEDGGFWTRTLPVAAFSVVDAEIELSAAHVSGKDGLDIDELLLRGSLQQGVARVEDLGMTWTGGKMRVRADLDGRAELPTGRLVAWIEGAKVEDVLAQLSPNDLGRGLADVHADLRSRGRTLAEMLGHVDGQLVFYGWEGAVPTRYSRALQLDVVPLPGDRGSGEVVNCVVADFEAASGLVRVESFLLDTPGQQVLVTGSVDLGGRTLDIRLTPILKQNIPGRRVTAAVRIRGPLDDPRITPEPLTTAGLVTQAVIEPALAAMRQWLPGVGGAIDEARRSAGRAIGATGVPGPGDVWLPGVDVSCEKFLAQERVARALADRPAPPGQPARSAPDS